MGGTLIAHKRRLQETKRKKKDDEVQEWPNLNGGKVLYGNRRGLTIA